MSSHDMICRLCKASAPRKSIDERIIVGTAYTLHQCSVCLVQWWEPFENPGASWYEHDERYAGRNRDPILKPNGKHRGVIAHMGSTKGNVLDIGCGVGNFLAYAQKEGWEPWGIDFDADGIASGKETFGLSNLYVTDLQGFIADHPGLQFNLITFFDVFEHLDDHNQFLQLVNSILAPGGSIALSTPYRHGWRWLMPHDLPPRHLTRWEDRSLAVVLGSHGIQMTRFVRFPASLYFIVLKLRFRYGAWSSVGLVRKVTSSERRQPGIKGQSTELFRSRFIRAAAKAKDYVIFGIPALVLWIGLLPLSARYTDLYVIADRKT